MMLFIIVIVAARMYFINRDLERNVGVCWCECVCVRRINHINNQQNSSLYYQQNQSTPWTGLIGKEKKTRSKKYTASCVNTENKFFVLLLRMNSSMGTSRVIKLLWKQSLLSAGSCMTINGVPRSCTYTFFIHYSLSSRDQLAIQTRPKVSVGMST